MNKKLIVTLIMLLVGAAGLFVLMNRDGMNDTATNKSSTNNQDLPAAASDPSLEPGFYVDYTDGIISSAQGTKILFFHAPWCPQCRALDADINEKGAPGGVTIIKVDYDSMQELRQKYGVTIQTTLVKVDDDGNLVDKYVAYDDPSVESLKANLL